MFVLVMQANPIRSGLGPGTGQSPPTLALELTHENVEGDLQREGMLMDALERMHLNRP